MQRACLNIAVTYLGRKVRFFIQSSCFINGRYFSWPASDNFGSIIGVSVNKPGFVHDLEKFLSDEKQKLNIQRFKGLGEMNPEELWQTTLNPENRTLLKIEYSKGSKEKSKEDQNIIKILMGDEVAPRKDFITEKALEVENLDI